MKGFFGRSGLVDLYMVYKTFLAFSRSEPGAELEPGMSSFSA